MTSKDYADAVRAGTMAASRLLRRLALRDEVESRGGNVDIFGVFPTVNLPLLIRPLDGLLGAYLSYPEHGVLVTTERPMSIQRWTAAHELGHFTMGHKPSLDNEDVLRRLPLETSSLGGDFQEDEANAFAAAFLMPRWLVNWHAARQGWIARDFLNPSVVYQLSLRIGVSFEAMCWTLARRNYIAGTTARVLLETKPKTLKMDLLGPHRPADYRGDVWLLTDRDAGTQIDGSRNDLFVLRLEEHAAGGYLWNIEQLRQSGFAIVRNETAGIDDDSVGSPVIRSVTGVSPEAHRGNMVLTERRPWDPDPPLSTLNVEFDFTGPEEKGLSRAERRSLLEMA